MYSRHHFAASVVVGGLVAILTDRGILLIVYGSLVGTLIDLDHFPIAWYTTGDWAAVDFALNHPIHAVVDQSALFDDGDIHEFHRLLTHALIGGIIVGGLFLVDGILALFTALILYLHFVIDLLTDLRRAARDDRHGS